MENSEDEIKDELYFLKQIDRGIDTINWFLVGQLVMTGIHLYYYLRIIY
jgi:hypothetical protein